MFQVECPNCGKRNVSEFRYGGEVLVRPLDSSDVNWVDYLYLRDNAAGVQAEWWYHRMGCQRWFKLDRNTLENQVLPPKEGH